MSAFKQLYTEAQHSGWLVDEGRSLQFVFPSAGFFYRTALDNAWTILRRARELGIDVDDLVALKRDVDDFKSGQLKILTLLPTFYANRREVISREEVYVAVGLCDIVRRDGQAPTPPPSWNN
jgi:hypothetical protein